MRAPHFAPGAFASYFELFPTPRVEGADPPSLTQNALCVLQGIGEMDIRVVARFARCMVKIIDWIWKQGGEERRILAFVLSVMIEILCASSRTS
jgi:hypothetical protein